MMPLGPLNLVQHCYLLQTCHPQLNAKGQVSELVNSPAFLTHLQLPQVPEAFPTKLHEWILPV